MLNFKCEGLVRAGRTLCACAGATVLLAACTINGGELARQNQDSSENAPMTTQDTMGAQDSHGGEPHTAAAVPSQTDAAAADPAAPESSSIAAIAQEVAAAGGAIALVTADGAGQAGHVDIPAWSTIKVPVAIAALRNDPSVAGNVAPAIQQSSNADAEALWASMGDPATAGQLTQAVLNEGGSSAMVQTTVVRPGFSSFGQTNWTLPEQAQFATRLRCMNSAEQVVSGMGNIAGDQAYGLGRIPGAMFKGGWGPDEAGMYKVRQFGLVPAGEGYIGVAIAAAPADGSYASGQAILDQMAAALQQKLGSLKGNAC